VVRSVHHIHVKRLIHTLRGVACNCFLLIRWGFRIWEAAFLNCDYCVACITYRYNDCDICLIYSSYAYQVFIISLSVATSI
jgi:hypothetical protein